MIVLILTEMTDTLPMIHEIKIMVHHFVETMRDLETILKVIKVKITFNSRGKMEGLEIFKANRTIMTSINGIIHELINNFR